MILLLINIATVFGAFLKGESSALTPENTSLVLIQDMSEVHLEEEAELELEETLGGQADYERCLKREREALQHWTVHSGEITQESARQF